jgi:hypothetical protein
LKLNLTLNRIQLKLVMIRFNRFLIYLGIIGCFLTGFGVGQTLESVETAFRDFEYEKVIELADQLLTNEDSLTQQTIIALLRMKAIAHFSLDEEVESEKSFLRILDLDQNFNLSARETSPKIIDFFEKIKSSYEPKLEPVSSEVKTEPDSTVQCFRQALGRSLIFPGWGHYYLKQNRKALILGIPAGISLATGVYYILLTAKREKDYLNATRTPALNEKYDTYNSAYKTRNILLLTYAVIWVYGQFDLLKNGEDYISSGKQLSFYPVLKAGETSRMALRINF